MMNELRESLQRDLNIMKRTAVQNKKKRCKAPRMRDFIDEELSRQTENNEEVKVYDMKELMTKEEFFKLDEDMQHLYMTEWRNNYTSKAIRGALRMSCKSYYGLLNKLGITVRSYTKPKEPTKPKELTKPKEPAKPIVAETEPATTSTEVTVTPQTLISWTGSATGELAAQKFNAIALLLSESDSYEIKVEICQKN